MNAFSFPSPSPFKLRLFWLLWLGGMAGVMSLLALPVSLPADVAIPVALVRLAIVLQPTVLLTVAVFTGVQLAPLVGLKAPVAQALAGRKRWGAALRPQVIPGLAGGIASGSLLVILTAIAPQFSPNYLAAPPPLVVRLLYGGITEELLVRWGVMTFLVWIGWRFVQRQRGRPSDRWIMVAIGLSAGLFALAHLPFAIAVGVPLTVPLLAILLVQNALFALVAGYLFWRYGLEAAVIAHWAVHGVLAVLPWL